MQSADILYESLKRERSPAGHSDNANLWRVLKMSPSELIVRTRQAMHQKVERVRTNRRYAQPAPVSVKLVKSLIDVACDRFFVGAVHAQTPSLIDSRLRGTHEQLLDNVTSIRDGRFDLLGYSNLYFGQPVDWHLDPITGCRAPLLHWSDIDPLDPAVVGDSKVVWELNRHQWLIGLGQAYRCTNDERYVEMFVSHVSQWIQANPPGCGINWCSSLEVSVRLISWSWALALFRGAQSMSPVFAAEMLECIAAHANHVQRYLSYYFSPNTHLTGEALGLFYAGVLFPHLSGARRWRSLGRRILIQQINRQVHADGVYFEQSTGYQRYTIEIYLQFLMLAAHNGVEVPMQVATRVQQMLDFLLAVRWPNGAMPAIGDADGGTLFPFVRRDADDFRGVFAVAAVAFDRSDYAWAAQGLAPEVLWFFGPAGCATFDALLPVAPTKPASQAFSDGGYVVMRNHWQSDAHQLIFDTGALGCGVSSGHGHADLLSIQCACFGQPQLIDPGTGVYTADVRWRNHFRSTAAHNTIVVDGRSQAVPAGPFKWRRHPRAQLLRWVSTPNYDLADAAHDAYDDLPDPVRHRRRVLFRKSRYWVVVDELIGSAEHDVEMNFQFASLDLELSPEGWAIARQPGSSREFRLLAVATAPLSAIVANGERDPIWGWISPDYGRRQPAPLLTFETRAQLPLRIVTLLFPTDDNYPSAPVVATSMEHRRIDLVFPDCIETVHIGRDDIVIERLA